MDFRYWNSVSTTDPIKGTHQSCVIMLYIIESDQRRIAFDEKHFSSLHCNTELCVWYHMERERLLSNKRAQQQQQQQKIPPMNR